MTQNVNDIQLIGENGLISFLPSSSWNIAAADYDKNTKAPFSWLQVFWDTATFTDTPVLAVWSGQYQTDGTTPLVNPVYFAFPGERVFFKGKIIYTTGTDRYGNTITSTPFASLERIVAYGGNK